MITDNKRVINSKLLIDANCTNEVSEIIDSVLAPGFRNKAAHCAFLPQSSSRQAFYTECFAGNTTFFPGGNIGNIAVNRTVNNILCSGATPRYLSVGFLIEEGFALADLRQIAAAVSDAARIAEVEIAACDFKVLKHCATGGICLTAACIGELPPDIDLSPENIRCGDKILISGDIGRHAAAVASLNKGEATLFDTISDTASLGDIVHNLLDVCGNDIRVLGLLSESGLGKTIGRLESVCGANIVIDREAIPVTPDVAAVCSRFDIDLLRCSSEGVIIAVVPESLADAALAAIRRSAHGDNAAIIGYVADSQT